MKKHSFKNLKRKKIFFFHGFQSRYVFLVAGSLTVLLLFAGFHGLFIAATSLSPEVLGKVKPDLLVSTWRLFLVGFLYIGVLSVAAVFLSHRAVGPTERLEEEITRIAESEGETQLLKVREGDELENLVEAVNHLIVKLSKNKR